MCIYIYIYIERERCRSIMSFVVLLTGRCDCAQCYSNSEVGGIRLSTLAEIIWPNTIVPRPKLTSHAERYGCVEFEVSNRTALGAFHQPLGRT